MIVKSYDPGVLIELIDDPDDHISIRWSIRALALLIKASFITSTLWVIFCLQAPLLSVILIVLSAILMTNDLQEAGDLTYLLIDRDQRTVTLEIQRPKQRSHRLQFAISDILSLGLSPVRLVSSRGHLVMRGVITYAHPMRDVHSELSFNFTIQSLDLKGEREVVNLARSLSALLNIQYGDVASVRDHSVIFDRALTAAQGYLPITESQDHDEMAPDALPLEEVDAPRERERSSLEETSQNPAPSDEASVALRALTAQPHEAVSDSTSLVGFTSAWDPQKHTLNFEVVNYTHMRRLTYERRSSSLSPLAMSITLSILVTALCFIINQLFTERPADISASLVDIALVTLLTSLIFFSLKRPQEREETPLERWMFNFEDRSLKRSKRDSAKLQHTTYDLNQASHIALRLITVRRRTRNMRREISTSTEYHIYVDIVGLPETQRLTIAHAKDYSSEVVHEQGLIFANMMSHSLSLPLQDETHLEI